MRALALVVVSVVAACHVGGDERERAEIDSARALGRELFFGRAACHTCHRIGEEGTQVVGPNLGVGDGFDQPIARRERQPGLTAVEYVVESILEPDAYVVTGYPAGKMTQHIDQPPIALARDEVVALALFVCGEGPQVPKLRRKHLEAARARFAALRPAP